MAIVTSNSYLIIFALVIFGFLLRSRIADSRSPLDCIGLSVDSHKESYQAISGILLDSIKAKLLVSNIKIKEKLIMISGVFQVLYKRAKHAIEILAF